MDKQITLDEFEQDIEDNFDSLHSIAQVTSEMTLIKQAALEHKKRKKSITLRVHEMDIEVMRIKASKLGKPILIC